MDLNSKLIRLPELYCSVCKNFLNTPIMLSKIGNNICGRCYMKRPTQSDLLPNVALENIIKLLTVPCRYKSEGCRTETPHKDITQHELGCSFRKHNCPSNITHCIWRGVFTNLLEHFETKHSELLIESDNNIFDFNLDISNLPFKKQYLVVFRNELFLLCIKTREEKMLFSLEYVGDDEKVTNFEYSIEEIGAEKGTCFKQNESKKIQHYNIINCNYIAVDVRILQLCGMDNLQVKLKIHDGRSSSLADENLLMHLECPICNQYMLPPIHQCINGHNICNKCRSKIGQCPTCRGRLENTRNFALEAFTNVINYPCCNRDNGCTAVFSGAAIERHEIECKLHNYQCPITDNNCSWQGKQSELLPHLINKHHLEESRENKFKLESTGVRMPYPGLMNSTYTNYKTMIAFGEIFNVGYKLVSSQTTSWCCKVMGLRNNNKFRYEIKYSSDNSDTAIIKYADCFVFTSDDDFYSSCIRFQNSITAALGNIVTCKIYRK